MEKLNTLSLVIIAFCQSFSVFIYVVHWISHKADRVVEKIALSSSSKKPKAFVISDEIAAAIERRKKDEEGWN